jgi:predicted aldo/keto reductase-like oxidoreductase/dTDP-4-amino-4,6-dideoxygalactose transaminase
MKKRNIKQLDMDLPPLGFGVMRLEQNDDYSFPKESIALLAAAMEKGINYFDTGYDYLGGKSEALIHDALVRKYPRNSYYIADKLPVWHCKSRKDMDRIFNTQLERLGIEYIDFYLLHALNRFNWSNIYNLDVLGFLDEKRREGRILKVGFSIHDNVDTLKTIEELYSWDFIQLQINYYDWHIQHSKDNYAYLLEREIPCFVMEPVGGGRLSTLPPLATDFLRKVRPDSSSASWALRFVAALSNVAITLSGMSNMSQLDENIETFSTFSALSKEEEDALVGVVQVMQSINPIPCTACNYCVDKCPKSVDIPRIFQVYNDCKLFDETNNLGVEYNMWITSGRRADSCISCGKCITLCPQKIDIPQELLKIHNKAEVLSIGVDIEKLRGKDNIVLFGSGAEGKRVLAALKANGIAVHKFCDNNSQSWGSTVEGVEIINPDVLSESDATVLITSYNYHNEIKNQLAEMGILAVNYYQQMKESCYCGVEQMKPILVTRSSLPPFEEYIEEIRGLWESRWLTNAGCMNEDLTDELQKYLDADNFLLFSNGHMALELGIQALGLKGEVITTPFTFVSTTQAIIRNGLTPVFCDVDPVRYTLDPCKIEALINENTCAIVAVHVYGIPCNTVEIQKLAAKHGLKVIYDAAHSFGVRYKGKPIAQYGDISMFSFHATKLFHTVEGGGLAFKDKSIYEKIRHLRDFGLCPGGLDADNIGANAKMSEFHSAMGLCNLRYIDTWIEDRKAATELYNARLGDINGLHLFPEVDGLKRNYAYYPVVFHDDFGKSRDEVCDALQKHEITARKYFYPLTSEFSCYKGLLQPNETPIAQDIASRVLCLPLYADITKEVIDEVCDIILD